AATSDRSARIQGTGRHYENCERRLRSPRPTSVPWSVAMTTEDTAPEVRSGAVPEAPNGAVPELARLTVTAGARVVIVSDLHLPSTATPASTAAAVTLARTVEAWVGPGLLVFAGDTVELLAEQPDDAAAGLQSHRRLTDAVRAFAAGGERAVLYLISSHDTRL